jgi:hypothetical protein
MDFAQCQFCGLTPRVGERAEQSCTSGIVPPSTPHFDQRRDEAVRRNVAMMMLQ